MARDSGRPGRRIDSLVAGSTRRSPVAGVEVAGVEVAGPGITGHAPRDTGNGPDRFRPASRGTAPALIHGDKRAGQRKTPVTLQLIGILFASRGHFTAARRGGIAEFSGSAGNNCYS